MCNGMHQTPLLSLQKVVGLHNVVHVSGRVQSDQDPRAKSRRCSETGELPGLPNYRRSRPRSLYRKPEALLGQVHPKHPDQADLRSTVTLAR